jgi:hypothetical protein
LQRRLEELACERWIAPKPPQLIGAALIVPLGLLRARQGYAEPAVFAARAAARAEIERLAIEAVMRTERALGFEPVDVGAENRGYDIESRDPPTDRLRLIEVKGRVRGAETVTVTRNELLCGLNAQETSTYILARRGREWRRIGAALRPPAVRLRVRQRRGFRQLQPATTSGAIDHCVLMVTRMG